MQTREDLRRKAAADPTRLRIWEQFVHEPREWTAKEIGARLGLPANGLYYHLRILEAAGFIEVARVQASGRMVERVFRGVDLMQKVRWDISDPIQITAMNSALLEAAKADVESEVFRAADDGKLRPDVFFPLVGTPSFGTTREEIGQFHERLLALIREFRDRAKLLPRETTLKLTYALREGHSEPASP